jgi:hypothetical protein
VADTGAGEDGVGIMTDLKSTLQVVLQESGFRTSLVPVDGLVSVCFEDEDILGFACIFEDVRTLLARWEGIETTLLVQHASHLQVAGDKSRNVYCVFLSSGSASTTEQHELNWIEENQERTRKIAASGINGQEELVGALLPVLPLQYRAVLSAEDLTERLRKRIDTISPAAAPAALDDKVSPAEVARLLGAPT